VAPAATALAAAILGAATNAQAGGEVAAARAAFDRLDALRQAMIVRRLDRQLAQSAEPAVRRVLAAAGPDEDWPAPEAREHFDAAQWAKGAAPQRRVIPAVDARHAAVREQIKPSVVLADLHRSVTYDWRKKRIVRAAAEPSFAERFGNYLSGYAPRADVAYARVLAELDRDREESLDKLADYFEHAYADRDGGVYEGITLYDAYYSEQVIEMPDVDAIAFAVTIMGDKSFSSPIPADERRDALYRELGEHAFTYRVYRTMREAAAAAVVSGAPSMDPRYEALVPRFHYLLTAHEDDLEKVRRLLARVPDREEWLQRVDDAVRNVPGAYDAQQLRKQELLVAASHIRRAAIAAVEAEAAKRP
jgi:hypothetical protein